MSSGKPDLEALANRFDPASRDTYLSLYADLTDSRHGTVLDDRAKEVRAALADRSQVKLFDEAYAQATMALMGLYGRGHRGAAVFSSPTHAFLEAWPLAADIPTRLVLDSSPYIRPLARYADEYESFILVLMDAERGAVYLVEEARAEIAHSRQLSLIGRHRNGGQSQARYQRHRQGIVDRFYDDLLDQVAKLLREGEAKRVVVAGPGQGKRQMLDRAPKAVKDAVIAVEDVDFDDSGNDALVRRFIDLARHVEAEESREAVEALRTELLRGELATTGPFPVARAARDGRIDILVVLKDHPAGGRKCEEHQSFFAPGATCSCGNKGTDVDLVNEAVEYAIRAGSRVEFVDEDDFLESVGGVGAVLRW